MKKLIFVVAISLGLVSPTFAQNQDPDWAVELGISKAWLNDQKLGAGATGKTKDNFDLDAVGIDIRGLHQVDPNVQVGIGFGRVGFDAKTVPITGTGFDDSYSFDDIEITTFYTTVRYGQRNGAWEPFGVLDLGIAQVDDSDLTESLEFLGSQTFKVYKGGTNLYWSLGVGVKYHINKNVYTGLTYKYKDYGSLDTASGIIGLKDLELRTNNLEWSVGVKF